MVTIVDFCHGHHYCFCFITGNLHPGTYAVYFYIWRSNFVIYKISHLTVEAHRTETEVKRRQNGQEQLFKYVSNFFQNRLKYGWLYLWLYLRIRRLSLKQIYRTQCTQQTNSGIVHTQPGQCFAKFHTENLTSSSQTFAELHFVLQASLCTVLQKRTFHRKSNWHNVEISLAWLYSGLWVAHFETHIKLLKLRRELDNCPIRSIPVIKKTHFFSFFFLFFF